MNFGQKLELYKQRLGYKTYKEYGVFLGVSGDWITDVIKKGNLGMVDINRIQSIAEKLNITMDQLISNRADDEIILMDELSSNDLLYKLNEIQQGIVAETTFNNIQLNNKQRELAVDGIDVLKQLINSGI